MKETTSENKGCCDAFSEEGTDNSSNLKSKYLRSEIHLQKSISQNLRYYLCQAMTFLLLLTFQLSSDVSWRDVSLYQFVSSTANLTLEEILKIKLYFKYSKLRLISLNSLHNNYTI